MDAADEAEGTVLVTVTAGESAAVGAATSMVMGCEAGVRLTVVDVELTQAALVEPVGHATEPPAVPTEPPPAQMDAVTQGTGVFKAPEAM